MGQRDAISIQKSISLLPIFSTFFSKQICNEEMDAIRKADRKVIRIGPLYIVVIISSIMPENRSRQELLTVAENTVCVQNVSWEVRRNLKKN